MVQLNCLELDDIRGGTNYVMLGIVITAVVVFISGVIEGITNPGRCNIEED